MGCVVARQNDSFRDGGGCVIAHTQYHNGFVGCVVARQNDNFWDSGGCVIAHALILNTRTISIHVILLNFVFRNLMCYPSFPHFKMILWEEALCQEQDQLRKHHHQDL